MEAVVIWSQIMRQISEATARSNQRGEFAAMQAATAQELTSSFFEKIRLRVLRRLQRKLHLRFATSHGVTHRP